MRKSKFQRKRKRTEVDDLDITSLLDILVILLVFLLKSYNASDLKLNLVDRLVMPDSNSRRLGNHNVIVQVNGAKEIYLNDEKIAKLDFNSDMIGALYNGLKRIEEEKKKSLPADATQKEKDKKMSVNLVMDKSLSYVDLQKVMHTSASAGFPQFKLIVKGNY